MRRIRGGEHQAHKKLKNIIKVQFIWFFEELWTFYRFEVHSKPNLSVVPRSEGKIFFHSTEISFFSADLSKSEFY